MRILYNWILIQFSFFVRKWILKFIIKLEKEKKKLENIIYKFDYPIQNTY